MPENSETLTGWKRRIADHCGEHDIKKSDSAIRRMAARLHQRQVRMSDEDLARYITYSDPVGESVATNVDAGRTSLRPSNQKNGLEAQSAKICFEAVDTNPQKRN